MEFYVISLGQIVSSKLFLLFTLGVVIIGLYGYIKSLQVVFKENRMSGIKAIFVPFYLLFHQREVFKTKVIYHILYLCAIFFLGGIVLILSSIIFSGIDNQEHEEDICQNQLSILLENLIYCSSDDINLPDSLDVLIADGINDETYTSCFGVKYIYLSGLNTKSLADSIVLFDPNNFHRNGRNVMYLNKTVKWFKEEDFKSELSRMLKEPYRSQYTEESIKHIKNILE